jgi:anti-sigma28 factor (negative regulator of flagellin synthesis)
MTIDPDTRVPDRRESSLASGAAAVPRDAGVSPPTDQATVEIRALIHELSEKLRQMQDDPPCRVEGLAQAIREGRYTVSPEEIARSILANMTRGS